MNISGRIRHIRKTKKLNQREFAKKIGLTQTSLSMIELEKSSLTEKNIKLICAVFAVNEEWLRSGNGEMFDSMTFYQRELNSVFDKLNVDTQKLIVDIAKKLLKIQEKHNSIHQF